MKKFSFLIPFVAALLACNIFASCEKDDPVVVNDNQQTTSTTQASTPTSASFSDKNDPEGTIWLNIDSQEYSIQNGNYDIDVNWCSPDNFVVSGVYNQSVNVRMVRIGKITGLKDINTSNIPVEGWASIMSCEPGYGYIVQYEGYPIHNDTNTYYYAIQVVDHLYGGETGGICGAKIKYCPFSTTGGWNN